MRKFYSLILFITSLLSVQAAYNPFEPDIIQVTNTLVADVNVSPQVEFNNLDTTPVVNTDTLNRSFTSVTSNGVVCVPGTYLVDVALYHTGSSARTNPSVEVTVNSVSTGLRGANGYIRNADGHSESTTTVADLVQLVSTSKIGFDIFSLGNNGVVPAPAGQSSLRIVRIDDR